MTDDTLLTLDEIFETETETTAESEETPSGALRDFHRFFKNNRPKHTYQVAQDELTDKGGETADLSDIPSDESLSLYLQQITQVPLLTHEEEVALAKRMERGLAAQEKLQDETLVETLTPEEIAALQRQVEDGQAAHKHLAEANTRLVISIAKKYRGYGLPFMDLIQAGNVGLLRAVRRFDHRRGYRFSTYATWWIRQAVTRSLSSNKRTIRIPIHKDSWVRRVGKVSTRMHQQLGRRPTYEEIAEEMDEDPAKLRRILRQTQQSISLNKPVGNDGDAAAAELGAFIEDPHIPAPTESVEQEMLHKELEEILTALPPREAWVLKMRFGLHGSERHTLKELGKKLNLSKERIRQIQDKALRKLRHPMFRRHLEDFC
jgi:RNA polymerase primary sigma factor